MTLKNCKDCKSVRIYEVQGFVLMRSCLNWLNIMQAVPYLKLVSTNYLKEPLAIIKLGFQFNVCFVSPGVNLRGDHKLLRKLPYKELFRII